MRPLWYIYKLHVTLPSTTPRLQARSERRRSMKFIYIPERPHFAASVRQSSLIQYLNLQIIKINLFNKAVLRKPRLIIPLKLPDILIQPNRLFQIKLQTDLLQSVKYPMSTGICRRKRDHRVFNHTAVLPDLSP